MKENWINNVLNSADDRSKVIPDARLMEKLYAIPGAQAPIVKISPVNWMLAASVIMLLIINTAIFTNRKASSSDTQTTSSVNSFQETYFDYVNTEL